ncbi:MAG: acyl-CoA thioesterase [Bacteroidetes bacterium]|nr:acyl-CoA thioesterase [Bacteroidota bacterium]
MNPSKLEDFPIQSYDKLRYGDTDRQGHVNNAVFATFCETGRVELLYESGEQVIPEGASFVLASLQVDYLQEVNWPGRIDIGTGITRIGNSSIRIYQRLFQHGNCVAEAVSTIVQVDNQTGKSQPMTNEVKKLLANFRVVVKDV